MPQDESLITEIAEGNKADVDAAVAAARKAFDEGPWPRMTGATRARVLNKFADLLEANLEELAALETLVRHFYRIFALTARALRQCRQSRVLNKFADLLEADL